MKNKKNFIKIVEVGPRDGLQNEKRVLDSKIKYEYVKKLFDSGVKSIEIGSFVNPKKIPQMQNAFELAEKCRKSKILEKFDEAIFLVPNLKGIDDAINSQVKHIALFTAASDSFNLKNINCDKKQAYIRLKEVANVAKENHIKMRGYVSTVFDCPYSGNVKLSDVLKEIEKIKKLDVYEVSLGDTIGTATPKKVKNLLEKVEYHFGLDDFSMHFHDTLGMGILNVHQSLERGIKIFDSSSGGLGGCPYAVNATGNLCTEDLIYYLNSQKLKTNIDLIKLVNASKFILKNLDKTSTSKIFQSLTSKGKQYD